MKKKPTQTQPKKETRFDRLKAVYDNQEVGEIEQRAKGRFAVSVEAQKEFIEALWYLQKTRRFRENPAFKKATFERYLRDVFNITQREYEQDRSALFNLEPEVREFGLGRVVKVNKTLGIRKAEEVFKTARKSKQPLKTLEAAVEKAAPPKPPPTVKGSAPVFVETEVDRLRADLATAHLEIKAQVAQIDRLKNAVKARDAKIVELESMLDYYRSISEMSDLFPPAVKLETRQSTGTVPAQLG